MLSIAVELDYEVCMIDAQTTFMNADVEEDVFVRTAPSYEIANKSGVPLVMKLITRTMLRTTSRVPPSPIRPMHLRIRD